MAESVAQALSVIHAGKQSKALVTFTIQCAADGSMTSTAIETEVINYLKDLGYKFVSAQAYPGATAPDAADVTLTEVYGEDLLNGNGVNLVHATDTQSSYAALDGMPTPRPVVGTLTLGLANQGTADANIVIVLYFERNV